MKCSDCVFLLLIKTSANKTACGVNGTADVLIYEPISAASFK